MNERLPPEVSVVLVTWNSSKYLSRCLASIRAQTFQNFELIIVDNGSEDRCTSGLEDRYPGYDLKVERLPSNLGFAAANNLGARLARGKWLVLLNTDAFPEPDWLAELIKASIEHPEFSSFSSRQIQADNPQILDGAGDVYHVSGMAWRNGLGYPAGLYGLESAEVFSPCAAAAMYLREAFLDAGGFDEDYFSYFEDVDLGFRLQLRGHRCLYISTAVVQHVGSSTFGGRSDFAFYHTHRNLVWTFVKDMPDSMLWRYLPAHLILNLVYVLYYTLLGRGNILWRAKWEAAKGLSRMFQKRRRIQGNRKASLPDLKRVMEHGWLKPYMLRSRLRKAWHRAGSPAAT